MTSLDNDDLGMMLQYEVPILQEIVQHYEKIGYSHVNAELLAVNKYSRELRLAFEEGVPLDVEQRIIQMELESERLFVKIRGGRNE